MTLSPEPARAFPRVAKPAAAGAQLGIALAGELASSLDPHDVVNRLVRRAVETFQADRATLSSIEGDEIVMESTYSTGGTLDWAGRRYALEYVRSQPIVREALETLRPVLGGQLDVAAAAPELQPELREMAHTAVLPLVLGNRAVALLVLSRAGGGPFTLLDLDALQELGNVAMLALRNARLYADLEQAGAELSDRVRELTLLLDTAHALTSSLDSDVIYREVVRSAANLVTGGRYKDRRATIFRIEGDEALIDVQYDETGFTAGSDRFQVDDHPGLLAAVNEQRVNACPMSQVKGWVAGTAAAAGVQSGAYAPIRVGSAVVAVLAVAGRDSAGFGDSDLSMLGGIANLAGLALGNAEKLRLERLRSESLQEHADRMEDLERVKTQFLNLASHELRGPSTVLRGYLSMLTEGTLGELPPRLESVMPVLRSTSEQMHMLIEQMLEAARLEEGRVELHPVACDLHALVAQAKDQLSTLHAANERIVLDFSSEQPVLVNVDPERTLTIVGNLLDNALKYSGETSPVECAIGTDGAVASVRVKDHGIGIAQSDMPKLFTRFGRIVTRENSHISGSGLGLYLCRELAHLMGGEIRVSSEEGAGSTFELLLPLVRPTDGGVATD